MYLLDFEITGNSETSEFRKSFRVFWILNLENQDNSGCLIKHAHFVLMFSHFVNLPDVVRGIPVNGSPSSHAD